jgi:hypothetical protein
MSRARLEKRKKVVSPTCAGLICDGADEAVDLFEAEDDVGLMGEMAVT